MSKLPAYLRHPAMAPAVPGPEYQEKSSQDKREQREEGEPIPSLELLQGMSLSDFRRSGLVMVVRCAVLGDEVVWAADGTPTSFLAFDPMGRVVYRGEELRLLTLLGTHPEDLRAYHSLRKQVGGVEVASIGMAPPEEEKTEPTKKKKGAAA